MRCSFGRFDFGQKVLRQVPVSKYELPHTILEAEMPELGFWLHGVQTTLQSPGDGPVMVELVRQRRRQKSRYTSRKPSLVKSQNTLVDTLTGHSTTESERHVPSPLMQRPQQILRGREARRHPTKEEPVLAQAVLLEGLTLGVLADRGEVIFIVHLGCAAGEQHHG